MIVQLCLIVMCIVGICMPDEKLISKSRIKPGQSLRERAGRLKMAFMVVLALNVISMIMSYF